MNAAAKHTPGDWILSGDYIHAGKGERAIARLCHWPTAFREGNHPKTEREANGKLLAGAAAMSDALLTTFHNIRSLKAAKAPGLDTYDVWLQVVEDALRKAGVLP